MSVAKRIREQKLESSLIKSLSEKLINSVLLIVDVVQLDHAVIVQYCSVRSRGRGTTCVKGGVTHCKH